MTARDLDYGPLTRRVGLRDRLRTIRTDNVMVIGTTVVALLVVIPPTVLVTLLVTGNATDSGGVALLVLLTAGGIYAAYDVARQAGGSSALLRFAEVNDLVPVSGTIVTHYAGSLFADGSHTIRQGIRTRDERFVEIGDRFPTTGPRNRGAANRAEVYLRLRLTAPVTRTPYDVELVTPDLHEALTRFAGHYAVEASGRELTLFGTHSLAAGEEGRVREAFELADALMARTAVLAPTSAAPVAAQQTTSGIPVPALPGPRPAAGRRPSALKVVGWTLALMVVGPLAITVFMTSVDDYLRAEAPWAIPLVVGLLIAAVLAVVQRMVKASVTPGDGRHARSRD